MCYERPNTQSERIKVISNLRLKEIIFPEDFKQNLHEKNQLIIRKLLNHNPSERPTSQELLEFESVPPVLEEKKQQEALRHIIDNPHLKLYKYLVERCFNQTNNTEYTSNSNIYRNISKLDFVIDAVVKIFKLHGGKNLRMSTIVHQNSCYDNCQNCKRLMTRLGTLVSIPCNSRMPFAKYAALNNSVTWLRRFSVEKSTTPVGEVYECAFDIITPTLLQNFLPDAEILKVLGEIRDSFSGLESESFHININHSLLIKAIFLECGIEGSHQDYAVIVKILKFQKGMHNKKLFLHNYLPASVISKLAMLTEILSPFDLSPNMLQYFTDTKAYDMAKTALKELQCIVKTAQMLGVPYAVRMATGLMHNFEQHSGMIVELLYCSNSHTYVLAAGGRYDAVIEKFQRSMSGAEKACLSKYGVGISVYLENLCKLLEFEKRTKNSDVVVCSFNEKTLLDIKTKVLRELWSAGFSCSFICITRKKHLDNWCKDYNVSQAVLITLEDFNRDLVTLIQWNNRWKIRQERKVYIHEIASTLKNLMSNQQRNLGVPLHGQKPIMNLFRKTGPRIRTVSTMHLSPRCINNTYYKSNSVP